MKNLSLLFIMISALFFGSCDQNTGNQGKEGKSKDGQNKQKELQAREEFAFLKSFANELDSLNEQRQQSIGQFDMDSRRLLEEVVRGSRYREGDVVITQFLNTTKEFNTLYIEESNRLFQETLKMIARGEPKEDINKNWEEGTAQLKELYDQAQKDYQNQLQEVGRVMDNAQRDPGLPEPPPEQ